MKFLKKIINLIFILFLLTIIVHLNLNSSKNNLKLRYLSKILAEKPTDEDIKDICEGASDDLFNYYYKSDNYTIEEKTIEGNKEDVELIVKLINNEDLSDNGKKYIKKAFVWLLSFLLGLITFISLFFIIFCDCCNCCCGTQCCKGACSRVLLSFLTAGLFGLSFVLNITTVSLAPKTFKGLNGASCSLFHFINDLEKGETKETIPKWGGFSTLQNLLSEVKEGISTAKSDYGTKFDRDKNDFDDKIKTYKNDIKNGDEIVMINDNTYNSIEVNFPKGTENYAGESKNLIPEYVKTWGDNKKVGSYLYFLQYEYDNVLVNLNKVLDEVSDAFDTIKSDSTIEQQIDDTSNKIGELKEPIDQFKDKFYENWYKAQKNIDNKGGKSLKIIFSVTAIVTGSLTILFILVLFCTCNNTCFKLIIHLLYYITILLTVFIFFLAGFFGFVGKISRDAVGVIRYILSEENLLSPNPLIIGDNGESNNYINICINKDGDLKSAFNLGESLESLDKLQENKKQIDNYITEFSKITENPLITAKTKEIENSRTNYLNLNYYEYSGSGTTIGKQYPIMNQIYEINNYTSKDGKYRNPSCTYNYDEYWYNTTSVSGYKYPESYDDTAGNKILMYLYKPSLTESTYYTTRYSGDTCESKSVFYPNTNDAANAIVGFFNSIQTSMKSNDEDSINKGIADKNNKLNDVYMNVVDSSKTCLNDCSNVMNAIIGSLDSFLGDSGEFWNIINCSFVKQNLFILFDQLKNNMGKQFHVIGSLAFCIGVLQFLAVIFGLYVMNIWVDNTDNKSSDDEENQKLLEKN